MNAQTQKLTLCLLFTFLIAPFAHADESQQKLAEKLVTLLRSARSVVGTNLPFIADPTSGTLTTQKALELTKENFQKATKTALDESDAPTQQLLKAIKTVFSKAIEGQYKTKWTGIFPKKLLPMRFAREVSNEFTKGSSGMFYLKVTTPDDLLVNPENRADEWEKKVFSERFLNSDWEKKKPFFETTEFRGKPGLRFASPEYMAPACLTCHGGEDGAKLHPSKQPSLEGDFGGAISLFLPSGAPAK